MPIIIKSVEWAQTENMIVLKIPLRGVHYSKVDMFSSPLYIKASFKQYFFEAFLFYPVKHKESKCTFTSSHIIIELLKCEPLIWENLEMELTKQEKQELKKQYIEEEQQRLQEEMSQLKNKKCELKRTAVREQMALDSEQRQSIENLKEDEKINALKKMDLLKKPQKIRHKQNKNNEKNVNLETKTKIKEALPPPRVTSTLNVSFTPREFPTPCRESRLEEENQWLQKQAEARRSVGFISEDLRPEEHNPQFLKNKGDDFLRNKNYLAAASAYSFGIKLNNKYADNYVGRAKAHLILGNYHKTIQDCTKALELMKPEVSANLKDRALCVGSRGVALVNLGLIKEGISELKASLRLVPDEYFSSKLDEALDKLNETSGNT